MLNASVEQIKIVYQPHLIIVDEDARSTEPYHWFLLGNDTDCDILLVGDDVQLIPVILSSNENNWMVSQLPLSLFSRLEALGHTSFILLIQHRQIPLLAELTSTLYYQSQLSNGPGTNVSDRLYALATQTFVSSRYKFKGTPSLLSKVNGQAEKDSNGSSFNLANASTILKILPLILRYNVPPRAITVLTFYRA